MQYPKKPTYFKLLGFNYFPRSFLAYFPYFGKMKFGVYDLHAVCVSVNPPPPINF
jgi:hypothetical protein